MKVFWSSEYIHETSRMSLKQLNVVIITLGLGYLGSKECGKKSSLDPPPKFNSEWVYLLGAPGPGSREDLRLSGRPRMQRHRRVVLIEVGDLYIKGVFPTPIPHL